MVLPGMDESKLLDEEVAQETKALARRAKESYKSHSDKGARHRHRGHLLSVGEDQRSVGAHSQRRTVGDRRTAISRTPGEGTVVGRSLRLPTRH